MNEPGARPAGERELVVREWEIDWAFNRPMGKLRAEHNALVQAYLAMRLAAPPEVERLTRSEREIIDGMKEHYPDQEKNADIWWLINFIEEVKMGSPGAPEVERFREALEAMIGQFCSDPNSLFPGERMALAKARAALAPRC